MKFFVRTALILALAGCGGKKPDSAQEMRAFMANWERAVDSKNAAALDSLLTSAENAPPIEAQKLLNELFSASEVKSVDLRGRQFTISEKQATVTGLLIRSGIPDSMARLSLILFKTKKGWKLVNYRWEPIQPAPDTVPAPI